MSLASLDLNALWLEHSAVIATLFAFGTALFLVFRSQKQSLNLPRFEVTTDVLKTIEEAHAQVIAQSPIAIPAAISNPTKVPR